MTEEPTDEDPAEEPSEPSADEPAEEPAEEPALCGDWAAIGECESNPGFMLVSCKTACELKKLEEQYGEPEASPGDDGTYAYAPGGGGGDDAVYDMFGYGAQGDDGYEYGSQDDGAGAWGDDGYEYGAQGDDGDTDAAAGEPSHFYDDGGTEAEEPAAAASQPEAAEQPAAAAPEPTEAEEPAEPEPTFEKSTVAEAVAIDVNADTIDYEAKWAPMEVVIALFIFVTCAFSMTRLCRAKEDGQYAPVTRAISEEDLVAPEDDVERGPTLEDKRRMLD